MLYKLPKCQQFARKKRKEKNADNVSVVNLNRLNARASILMRSILSFSDLLKSKYTIQLSHHTCIK